MSEPIKHTITLTSPSLTGPAFAILAEDARVGLVSCVLCGATLLLSAAEPDTVERHRLWHALHGERP